jgi:hypothetical protein
MTRWHTHLHIHFLRCKCNYSYVLVLPNLAAIATCGHLLGSDVEASSCKFILSCSELWHADGLEEDTALCCGCDVTMCYPTVRRNAMAQWSMGMIGTIFGEVGTIKIVISRSLVARLQRNKQSHLTLIVTLRYTGGSLFVHQRNCVLCLLHTCIIHTYSYITCFGYLVAIFRCDSIQ